MEKLTDIAKDYLADFDVLTDARKEFESQLDAWWRSLFAKYLKPALIEMSQVEPHLWDNHASPGMCQCRAIHPQDVLLEVTDPRVSARGFYTVSLFVNSQPALKKLSRQSAAVKRLDDLAASLKVGGQVGLKWNNTELAREDIKILPDEPDETIKQVRDAVVRGFRLVMEHHLASSEEKAD
jgi:hypothetical protein